jgi:hypothetical protein|tara:strand:+ start:1028 stop:1159 length:132 start_codon:yes stop_codon:yes gene_type:complete
MIKKSCKILMIDANQLIVDSGKVHIVKGKPWLRGQRGFSELGD